MAATITIETELSNTDTGLERVRIEPSRIDGADIHLTVYGRTEIVTRAEFDLIASAVARWDRLTAEMHDQERAA